MIRPWHPESRGALLSANKVSKWLGVAPRTVRLWAECGEIPAIKVGKQWRFCEADIRVWLAQQNPNLTARSA